MNICIFEKSTERRLMITDTIIKICNLHLIYNNTFTYIQEISEKYQQTNECYAKK